MIAALMTGYHMIEREMASIRSAVLTGVTVPSEHLSLAQSHARSGALDHVPETDNRWARVVLADRMDETAAVEQHLGLTLEYQADGAPCRTHVKRFKIGVQQQNRIANRMHNLVSALAILALRQSVRTWLNLARLTLGRGLYHWGNIELSGAESLYTYR